MHLFVIVSHLSLWLNPISLSQICSEFPIKQFKKDFKIFMAMYKWFTSLNKPARTKAHVSSSSLSDYLCFQALICTTKMPDPNIPIINNAPEHLICYIVMTDKIRVPNYFHFVCNLTFGHAGIKTCSHLFDTVQLLNCWRSITSCGGNDKISKSALGISVHK